MQLNNFPVDIASEKDMHDAGKTFAAQLVPGQVVLLSGELGAGKTTFCKGVLDGLGVEEVLGSPTFTLMNLYELSPPTRDIHRAVHIDAYRVESEQEFLDIGITDYLFTPFTVCLIEWPEKIPALFAGRSVIRLLLTHTKTGRTISLASA